MSYPDKYNAPGSRAHTSKEPCASDYAKINEALYEWYFPATSKNIFPMGSQLVEKAKQIDS